MNLFTRATTLHNVNRVTALSIPSEPAEAKLPNRRQLYRHQKRVDRTHLPFLRHSFCMEQLGCQYVGGTSHAFLLLQRNECQNEIDTRYLYNYPKSNFLNK